MKIMDWWKHKKIFNQAHQVLSKINQKKESLESLSDQTLKNEAMLASNRWRNEANINNMADVLALIQEVAFRKLGMRPYDVQLMGAMILWDGKIAEMKTGEGKSLTVAIAACLGAAQGLRVHVVTVNEYLAQRDAQEFSPLYEFFNVEAGLIKEDQEKQQRTMEHQKNIVYGVNHEFGFDYLRDNMIKSMQERKMDRLDWVIIDEVDSILIDEARTPLIITGLEEDDLSKYEMLLEMIKTLKDKVHLEVHLKERQVTLTNAGYEALEKALIENQWIEKGNHLYEITNESVMQKINAVLSALWIYEKDKHYVIKDEKVVIVDENTGRLMQDRRWSEGLHQAIEAKEKVKMEQESRILASITYQTYFRKYKKLSGLTGTAKTQEEEFQTIYGLDVIQVKTHRPMIRKDHGDFIYTTKKAKWKAIVDKVKECQKRGQPVLIGTPDVEESEKISEWLTAANIEHSLLNAKNHEKEAILIEQAGRPGKVTVATNMAGRGTDIILGGNWKHELKRWAAQDDEERVGILTKIEDPTDDEIHQWKMEQYRRFMIKEQELKDRWDRENKMVCSAGGLMVIATARNESRRIDDQLKGRAGRQGDPGESIMIISLEDDLFKIYAQDKIQGWVSSMGLMQEQDVLMHPWLSKTLSRAQKTVENHFFNARKNLMDFDDVGSKQRDVIYAWRDEWLMADEKEWRQRVEGMLKVTLKKSLGNFGDLDFYETWEKKELQEKAKWDWDWNIQETMNLEQWNDHWSGEDNQVNKQVDYWMSLWDEAMKEEDGWLEEVRSATLMIIDDGWQMHLQDLKHLLEGIHLRAFAQKTPKWEYQREGYEMFEWLLSRTFEKMASFWVKKMNARRWSPDEKHNWKTQQEEEVQEQLMIGM